MDLTWRYENTYCMEIVTTNFKLVGILVISIQENGELLSGIICSRTVGRGSGNLLHIVALELGHEVAANFYSHIQLVVNAWLLAEGHTIGIGLCHHNIIANQ